MKASQWFSVILVFGVGGWFLTVPQSGHTQQPANSPKDSILVYRAGHLVQLDPKGKNEVRLTEDRRRFMPSGTTRLSPDSKSYAALLPSREPKAGANPDLKKTLYLRELADKEPGRSLEVEAYSMALSPDGSRIACTHQQPTGEQPVTHSLIELKSGNKTELKLPGGHYVTDWTIDGKWLITTGLERKPAVTLRVYRVSLDGKQVEPVTERMDGHFESDRADPRPHRGGGSRDSPDQEGRARA